MGLASAGRSLECSVQFPPDCRRIARARTFEATPRHGGRHGSVRWAIDWIARPEFPSGALDIGTCCCAHAAPSTLASSPCALSHGSLFRLCVRPAAQDLFPQPGQRRPASLRFAGRLVRHLRHDGDAGDACVGYADTGGFCSRAICRDGLLDRELGRLFPQRLPQARRVCARHQGGRGRTRSPGTGAGSARASRGSRPPKSMSAP